MRTYTLEHLSDAVLLRDLAALVAQDRLTTAALLAHMAEVDARRLYVPAGYPSMHAYCVEELRQSEDAAFKRIRAARAARVFPVLFERLAEGRLHLSGICLLAPYLTPENADELLEAAAHRRKSEIEEMLAGRFARQEVAAAVRAIVPFPHAQADTCDTQLAPGRVVKENTKRDSVSDGECAPGHVDESPTETKPAPHEGFLLQLTVGRSTLDKLRYAQALLSHSIPSGDVAQVLDRALDALITQLEKRKFGAGTGVAPTSSRGPRTPRRHSSSAPRPRADDRQVRARSRYIPALVRRAVWERDQGQCTFVSASGHRCGARRFLEFDHVDPVARGGEATVDRMRLRCRAHNQYEAERTFGEEFMSRKRREARIAAAEARGRAAAVAVEAHARAAAAKTAATAAAKEATHDVLAGLRLLGCRADEARRAAEFSATLQGATLEERMRAALSSLGRRLEISAGT